MNYEKEKNTAFLFSKYAPMYSRMSQKKKEKINKELEHLDLTTPGFLLEMCSVECTEFVELIETLMLEDYHIMDINLFF